jgi:FkbM family methyltransferase
VKSVIERFLKSINQTKFGARVNQVVGRAMMSSVCTVEHRGTTLSFVVPNHLNRWRIASFSQKEPETLEWIDGFAEGAVLWDIGANVGLYACYAAKRRKCQVFAFEPSVFNLELLARNVWVNGLTELVSLVPLPLTDKVSNSTLNMSTTDWGGAMSTFDLAYTHDGTALSKVFEFRTVGLSMTDAVRLLNIPRPDHIKLDVDGIEHLILKGGAAVLREVNSVLVEINERFEKQTHDSAAYLREAGLVLKEKRHSEMFDNHTVFSTSYNQIWHRP